MKRIAPLAAAVMGYGLGLVVACTSQQIQQVEQAGVKAATAARQAIALYKANQGSIDDVIAKAVAVAPQTGAAHTAAVDAATIAQTLKSNPAAIDQVDASLAKVQDFAAAAK